MKNIIVIWTIVIGVLLGFDSITNEMGLNDDQKINLIIGIFCYWVFMKIVKNIVYSRYIK